MRCIHYGKVAISGLQKLPAGTHVTGDILSVGIAVCAITELVLSISLGVQSQNDADLIETLRDENIKCAVGLSDVSNI